MHVFILIPALSPDGPIKGAIALANQLVKRFPVSLVALKPGSDAASSLDANVNYVCLGDRKTSIVRKMAAYRRLIDPVDQLDSVVSLSMCFSADMLNLFSGHRATVVCSVRGNLIENYRFEYGFLGRLLAELHLRLLCKADHLIAMTEQMASQVQQYSGKSPIIIGNFIDEAPLRRFRKSSIQHDILRLVFVGSLSERKRPQLLIKAVAKIKRQGVAVRLDVIGVGPLMDKLIEQVEEENLTEEIVLHGFLASPYELIASSSVFVLPSMSEGLSRASLEALYLGVPCVLRNTDGNSELIDCQVNGALFSNDEELPDVLIRTNSVCNSSEHDIRSSLLPQKFTTAYIVEQYFEFLGDVESARGANCE